MKDYFPVIEVDTNVILKYKIEDFNNLTEVKKKISNYYYNNYISNSQITKSIKNIKTGMVIEIWKSGIYETFGNAMYYKNLSLQNKILKLATMDYLAKMIKYGEIRANSALNYHNLKSKVRYYYLKCPIRINHIDYLVYIDIRKFNGNTGRFYIHLIKKGEPPGN